MDRENIFRITLNKFLKPVAQYLNDPTVSEILINGHDDLYIERGGLLEKIDAGFDDEESILSVARNIAQYTNKRITPLTSRLDSRLPDGSRVHMVFPRCSRNGLCIAIRKFSRQTFSLQGLVDMGALSDEAREYIEIVVDLGKNLIVSGGTGSGKTSLLNAISTMIPSNERIIVIEDSSELQLQQPHVVCFETAAPDRNGRGAVTIRDLFHSVLRMRPDRIVIGECRGGEALELIQAMTSGHGGSMSTLHANSCADAMNRLETMALMAGVEIPLFALRSQIASAIEVVVQLTRLNSGKRVITEINEVGSLTSDGEYHLTPIFEMADLRTDDQGLPVEYLKWTGEKSGFSRYLKLKGLSTRAQLTGKMFVPREHGA